MHKGHRESQLWSISHKLLKDLMKNNGLLNPITSSMVMVIFFPVLQAAAFCF